MIIIIIILLIIVGYLFYKLNKQKTELDHAINAVNNQAYAVAQEAYKKAKAELDAKLMEARKNADDEIRRTKENTELYKQAIAEGQTDYKEKFELQQKRAFEVFQEGLESYNDMARTEKEKICKELLDTQAQLDDYKKKLNATNEEIKRQRELEEKEDYYRIQITQDNVEDIAVIQSIREKLHKREYLDKMLYDNYIAKSVKEMVKRVIGTADPSGIYRITNIKTKESYIGKSVHVGDRWISHVKTACGLEGVADSQFQRALKKYGIDNWTFELLEECPKDQLTEREKFYIDYYDTKEYGYNMRNG